MVKNRFTLGKNERLKSRKLIEAVFSNGKNFAHYPFRAFYLLSENGFTVQAGFGVSGKNFRKAVDRNRIKRLAREAWRLQKNSLCEKLENQNLHLVLFLIYTGKELPEYDLVYNKMGMILQKLTSIVDENNSAHS